jgi:hypothetical protein
MSVRRTVAEKFLFNAILPAACLSETGLAGQCEKLSLRSFLFASLREKLSLRSLFVVSRRLAYKDRQDKGRDEYS